MNIYENTDKSNKIIIDKNKKLVNYFNEYLVEFIKRINIILNDNIYKVDDALDIIKNIISIDSVKIINISIIEILPYREYILKHNYEMLKKIIKNFFINISQNEYNKKIILQFEMFINIFDNLNDQNKMTCDKYIKLLLDISNKYNENINKNKTF
jgi:hypothetical protein